MSEAKEVLARLQELEAKATPGPWAHYWNGGCGFIRNDSEMENGEHGHETAIHVHNGFLTNKGIEGICPTDKTPGETLELIVTLRNEAIQALSNSIAATNELEKALAASVAREERLRAELLAGEASDGHHTHNELYDYRRVYNAALFNWLYSETSLFDIHKSRKHSDGELCFGGGWFIVVAQLPTGQISNHYRDEHWDLFNIPEREIPAPYDGHTPAVALQRLSDFVQGKEATNV